MDDEIVDGCPSRGLTVSRAAPKPDHRMNRATAAPHQPSICRFQKRPARAPSSTVAVARQSLRLSAAVAAMAADWMRLPIRRLERTM